MDEQGRSRRLPSYEDAVPVKLRRAADALAEVVRLLLVDTHGLGFVDMRILAYLSERPSASVGKISRDLCVDQAWISRVLQALGAKQLTVQTRDPSDSRIALASITDAGRELYEELMAAVTRCDASIMAGVDEDLVGELITRMETNLRTLAQQLRAQDSGTVKARSGA